MESMKQIIKSKKPYVYALTYPDGKIFYVGKGTGKRILDHEREARRMYKKSCRSTVIREIWATGNEVGKIILATFDADPDAFLYEASLIFFMDGLTNVIPGGGGGPIGVVRSIAHRRQLGERNKLRRGKSPSKESRIKMSEAQRNRSPLSEEQRRRMSKAALARGRKLSEEELRKLAASRKGYSRKPLSEETKRKISEAKKGKPLSEETRRKIGEESRNRIRKPFSEEVRRKMSEAQKRRRSKSMEVA